MHLCIILVGNRLVVCFLLVNSQESEFYMPTFRNTVPSSQADRCRMTRLSAYEDGTECSETSAYKIQTPGNYPEKKRTTYTTRRKFENKGNQLDTQFLLCYVYLNSLHVSSRVA